MNKTDFMNGLVSKSDFINESWGRVEDLLGEAWEAGWEVGLTRGMENSDALIYDKGYDKGYEDGCEHGNE